MFLSNMTRLKGPVKSHIVKYEIEQNMLKVSKQKVRKGAKGEVGELLD